jgi:hypothetical protein
MILNYITKNKCIAVVYVQRKVDDKTYCSYLLQSLNVDDLKATCKKFELKGYSGLNKFQLIEFIADSLSEEEIKKFIQENELSIISDTIELALKKIRGEDREKIKSIVIINPDKHEIQLKFEGFNWTTESYLSINKENIANPERDCDCRVGENNGLCNHFWVGFIFAYKEEFFKLSDWSLTPLPPSFQESLNSIELAEEIAEKDGSRSIALVDKSTKVGELHPYIDQRITILDGKVEQIEQKEYQFEERITKYHLIWLKKVTLTHQIDKMTGYDESKVVKMDDLKIRLSENSFKKSALRIGQRISCNGELNHDSFEGLVVKRVSKLASSFLDKHSED